MDMSQGSSTGSDDTGWRLKNMAKFNNKVINNVNRFRISGFENNPLMSKEHHVNDVIQMCARNGILADFQEVSDDLDKSDYRKFIDDGASRTMWAIIISTTNVNVADFAKEEQVSGLFIYNGAYVKPLTNVTPWKGHQNNLIIQAVEF